VRRLNPQHVRAVLRIAYAAVLIAVMTHTRADPDLFGHVRFGHDIVAARSVRLDDHYSFTSDRPWINHEWLSEVVMYFAYRTAGGGGLVALKLTLIALMLGAVALAISRDGATDLAKHFLIGLAVICTFPQTNPVRPQLFSLVLFASLLYVLLTARRHRRAPFWSIPIMALWVNLHGGWLVGAGTLIVWSIVGLFGDRPLRDKAIAVGTMAAALAATLVNPYGVQLWSFLRETVGFGRPEITDWQPIIDFGALFSLWAIVAALAIAAAVIAATRRTFDLQGWAVVLMFAIGSLRVGRLLSFFVLSVIMVLGPAVVLRRGAVPSSRRASMPLVPAIALLLALAVIGTGVTVSARNVSCVRIEDSVFPDQQAVGSLTAHAARGRLLTYFDYGEYAMWHLSPDLRVSIDGRRETVYSDQTIQQQLRFYFTPGDRAEIVKSLKPDYIWMPSRLDVAKDLAADGWKPMFSGPHSVILARGDVSEPTYGADIGTRRCFPGP
jgi:hypothetical protein